MPPQISERKGGRVITTRGRRPWTSCAQGGGAGSNSTACHYTVRTKAKEVEGPTSKPPRQVHRRLLGGMYLGSEGGMAQLHRIPHLWYHILQGEFVWACLCIIATVIVYTFHVLLYLLVCDVYYNKHIKHIYRM